MDQEYDQEVTRWDDGITTFGCEDQAMMRVGPVERGVRIETGMLGDAQDYTAITIEDDEFDRVLEAMLRARRYRRLHDEGTSKA